METLREKRDRLCRERRKEISDSIKVGHYIEGVLDMYNEVKSGWKEEEK